MILYYCYKKPLVIFLIVSYVSICCDLLLVRKAMHGQSTDRFCIIQKHPILLMNNAKHVNISSLYGGKC